MSAIALILAAGKGTRMKSTLPKPLVTFKDKPIIDHLIFAFKDAGIDNVALVVGHGHEEIKKHLGNKVKYVYQKEQKGTAHAVLQAKNILDWKDKNVFVFVGDSPLISPANIKKLLDHHIKTNADCSFLTADFPIKLPYARVKKDINGKLIDCIEEFKATEKELEITELFTSHYILKANKMFQYMEQITPDNKKGEYYFTDIIGIFLQAGLKVETVKIKEYQELVGLNTPEDIKWAEGYIEIGE